MITAKEITQNVHSKASLVSITCSWDHAQIICVHVRSSVKIKKMFLRILNLIPLYLYIANLQIALIKISLNETDSKSKKPHFSNKCGNKLSYITQMYSYFHIFSTDIEKFKKPHWVSPHFIKILLLSWNILTNIGTCNIY